MTITHELKGMQTSPEKPEKDKATQAHRTASSSKSKPQPGMGGQAITSKKGLSGPPISL